MKKRISKLIIVLLLCCVLAAAVGITFSYVKRPEDVSKKAIIMIPGLMGSNLMDEENKGFWAMDPDSLVELILDLETTVDRLQGLMDIAPDGTPNIYYRPANMSDGDKFMHTINRMLSLYYDYLVEAYPDWEIVNWQYDWRESNWTSAAKLEAFIESRGYDDIVFMSHSMGGHVVTKYLTKQENRDKTRLFIPHGTPFFGSYDVYGFIFGDVETNGVDFFKIILSAINADKAASSLAPVYELSPYAAFDETPFFANGERSISYNGEYITVEEEVALIKSLPTALMPDGSIKPQISSIVEYQNADFVKVNGEQKHITSLVPTEFVAGVGVSTAIGVYITEDKLISGYNRNTLGDGTVPLYSATAGNAMDADNVHLLYGFAHGSLMEKPASLELLKTILPKYLGEPEVK